MERADIPLLQAVARAAAALTDAGEAAVIALHGEEIVVLAVAGAEAQRTPGQRLAPGEDPLSYALAAGQSLTLAPTRTRAGPGTAEDQEAVSQQASLCIPCSGDDGIVGALDLRGRAGAGLFSQAAARAAVLLADIVTAALEAAEEGGRPAAPAPGELAAELAALAASDASRYGAIAGALQSLLRHG